MNGKREPSTKDLRRDLRSLGGGAAGAEEASRRAAGRLVRRAARDGLLDVAVAYHDSPVGRLLVAVTVRGVVRIEFPEKADDGLARLAVEVSPRILESARQTDPIRRELDRYFDGRLRHFETPVDLRVRSPFARRVLEATAEIPFGDLRTYRDVAERAGNRGAGRAAGSALGANPIPIVVPCHRVVGSDGRLTGYAGGLDRKELLLRLEGAIDGPESRPD